MYPKHYRIYTGYSLAYRQRAEHYIVAFKYTELHVQSVQKATQRQRMQSIDLLRYKVVQKWERKTEKEFKNIQNLAPMDGISLMMSSELRYS